MILCVEIVYFSLPSLSPTFSVVVREENDNWVLEEKLEGHSDWVRDVAWCPSVGLPLSRIASCSQVHTLYVCLCMYVICHVVYIITCTVCASFLPTSLLLQDCKVIIWTKDESVGGKWNSVVCDYDYAFFSRSKSYSSFVNRYSRRSVMLCGMAAGQSQIGRAHV